MPCLQVKLNVQRTLAIELQRLSVQFRKQQKAYLNRLRQKNGPSASGASLSVLDDTAGTSGREALDPEYDPGFNEIQVHFGPESHVPCIACALAENSSAASPLHAGAAQFWWNSRSSSKLQQPRHMLCWAAA